MKCRSCLNQIENSQKFCPNCGAAQSLEVSSSGQMNVPSQEDVAFKKNNLSMLDWWSKKWWVACKIQISDSDQDGWFKSAPKTDLSHLPIQEVLLILIDKNNPSLVVEVTLLDVINEATLLSICSTEDKFHLNLTINQEKNVYRNDMHMGEVVEFLEILNLNGPKNVFNELPRPPWEDA